MTGPRRDGRPSDRARSPHSHATINVKRESECPRMVGDSNLVSGSISRRTVLKGLGGSTMLGGAAVGATTTVAGEVRDGQATIDIAAEANPIDKTITVGPDEETRIEVDLAYAVPVPSVKFAGRTCTTQLTPRDGSEFVVGLHAPNVGDGEPDSLGSLIGVTPFRTGKHEGGCVGRRLGGPTAVPARQRERAPRGEDRRYRHPVARADVFPAAEREELRPAPAELSDRSDQNGRWTGEGYRDDHVLTRPVVRPRSVRFVRSSGGAGTTSRRIRSPPRRPGTPLHGTRSGPSGSEPHDDPSRPTDPGRRPRDRFSRATASFSTAKGANNPRILL